MISSFTTLWSGLIICLDNVLLSATVSILSSSLCTPAHHSKENGTGHSRLVERPQHGVTDSVYVGGTVCFVSSCKCPDSSAYCWCVQPGIWTSTISTSTSVMDKGVTGDLEFHKSTSSSWSFECCAAADSVLYSFYEINLKITSENKCNITNTSTTWTNSDVDFTKGNQELIFIRHEMDISNLEVSQYWWGDKDLRLWLCFLLFI